ncbi:MAG: oligosaccharide flippase family protein [Desulfocapsaceae bacterium]|nr:oligosaccharide flippase family protein [Desulfosporosinus sp.]MDR3629530.1 oligosaccharide flippase family protein [Desulfocapsaceae bacterium]
MSIRKKVVLQFFGSNIVTVISFLLSMILSRMLTPSEIGIFSMAAVIVSIAHVFRDFGVVAYIKQKKELEIEVLRAAMGMLICSSWLIALVLYFLSWPISNFYHQEGVRATMQILAAGFLFIPFGSISQAVLARELQVEKTVLVNAVSTMVYFCASLLFAWTGFSYLTMALANLVNIIVSVIGFTLMRPRWLPWLPSLKGWKNVFHFGSGAIITSIVQSFDEALGDIMLGRLSVSHFVGVFSRANSTVKISFEAVRPTMDYISLPYLAKVHHSGEVLSKEIVRSTSYLTSLLWPTLAATAFYSLDIIKLLYGNNWVEAAPAVPWLCLAFGVRATFYFVNPATTSIGKPYWSALPIGFGVLLKIVFIFATFDGSIVSFSRSLAFAEIFASVLYVLAANSLLGMSLSLWWSAVSRSVKLTIVIILVLVLLENATTGLSIPVVRLLVAGALLVPLWFLLIFVMKHPISAEFSRLISHVKGRW